VNYTFHDFFGTRDVYFDVIVVHRKLDMHVENGILIPILKATIFLINSLAQMNLTFVLRG